MRPPRCVSASSLGPPQALVVFNHLQSPHVARLHFYCRPAQRTPGDSPGRETAAPWARTGSTGRSNPRTTGHPRRHVCWARPRAMDWAKLSTTVFVRIFTVPYAATGTRRGMRGPCPPVGPYTPHAAFVRAITDCATTAVQRH